MAVLHLEDHNGFKAYFDPYLFFLPELKCKVSLTRVQVKCFQILTWCSQARISVLPYFPGRTRGILCFIFLAGFVSFVLIRFPLGFQPSQLSSFVCTECLTFIQACCLKGFLSMFLSVESRLYQELCFWWYLERANRVHSSHSLLLCSAVPAQKPNSRICLDCLHSAEPLQPCQRSPHH